MLALHTATHGLKNKLRPDMMMVKLQKHQYTKEQPVPQPTMYCHALSLTPGWAVEVKGRFGYWKAAAVLTQDTQRKTNTKSW